MLSGVTVLCLGLALPLGALPQAQGAPPPDEARQIEHFVGLAKVWGYCKYFHPDLGGPGDAWDAALVAVIPEVYKARTAEQYAAAVQRLLSTLEDPLTRVLAPPGDQQRRDDRVLAHRMTPEGVLVVTAGNYYALATPAADATLGEISQAMADAKAMVLDLRSSLPPDPFARFQLAAAFAEMQRLLISQPLAPAGERRRVYYGLETATVFSSGQYRSGYFTQHAAPIVPAAYAREIPVVFVLNQNSALLASLVPLQASGRARVVFEGDFNRHSIGDVATIELPHGLTAQVRRSRPVLADGTSGDVAPDTVIARPVEKGDTALELAISIAVDFEPSEVRRAKLPAVSAPLKENPYWKMEYPGLEYRLLAAFRLWAAIEHFFPYKSLLDEPWEQTLRDMIPRFEEAADGRQYNVAVAQMAERLSDSHAYVSGSIFNEQVIQDGYPPIRARIIGGVPVVSSFRDAEAAARAGVEIGDEIVNVDGHPASEALERLAGLVSASTEQSLQHKAAAMFMNGPVGSNAVLTLRGTDGQLKRVELERHREDYTTLYHRERDGEVIRILPGNIGYVDLDRLSNDQVDLMFQQLKHTRAIIFDMRGYPRGTIWAIAPRLASQSRIVARFQTPAPGHNSPESSTEAFVQVLQPAAPGEPSYRGRTVMLIDERSQSQAEHTGLYLKAANGTIFVGSPTAGANGEITSVTLPGGVTVGFTGQGVTWPDGRQLQRVGLLPDVEARPTLQGIRAGRDEVLEAAVRFLNGT